MSHEEFLKSLEESYKPKHKIRVIKSLKRKIQTLNSKYTRKGDFIQSKNGFKNKVGSVVRVPKTLFYTTNPKELLNVFSDFDEFVMKPNHLSRGLGIRVLNKGEDGLYVDMNGDVLTEAELVEEAEAVMKIHRGADSNTGIMLEERIRSHKNFLDYMVGDGVADIRMIFYFGKFLFGVARFPTLKSKGYGNIIRGASWGVFLDGGVFVDDERFLPCDVKDGILPFYEEMLTDAKKVIDLYQFPFQTVDLTVNDKEEVVVLESEKSPQIEAYFTKIGGTWLYKKILMGLRK